MRLCSGNSLTRCVAKLRGTKANEDINPTIWNHPFDLKATWKGRGLGEECERRSTVRLAANDSGLLNRETGKQELRATPDSATADVLDVDPVDVLPCRPLLVNFDRRGIGVTLVSWWKVLSD